MHFLLDTHYLIWALYDHKRLPKEVIEIVKRADSRIEYSIVSLWEIEIKHVMHPKEFVFDSWELHHDAQLAGLHMIGLEPYHINTLGSLKKPDIEHKDPLERMLIAQAKFENIYLLTRDKRLNAYREECVYCL